jgi:phosphate transport system permease protein
MPNQTPKRPVPERFIASRATLRLDQVMTWLIRAGGLGIIVAVLGIFVFILAEVIPLFEPARFRQETEAAVPSGRPGDAATAITLLGVDEWAQKPFLYRGGAEIQVADLSKNGAIETLPVELPPATVVTTAQVDGKQNRVILGTADGRLGSFKVSYTSTGGTGKEDQVVTPSVKVEAFEAIGQPGKPLKEVSYGDGGAAKVMAAIQEVDGRTEVHALCIRQKKTLMGVGKPAVVGRFDLTADLKGHPVRLLASAVGDALLVADDRGMVYYFYFTNGTVKELRQTFQPFAAESDPTLSTLSYVFGDVSVVVCGATGKQEVWSLYNQSESTGGETVRRYGKIKEFPPLDGAATFYAASQRNKTFLTGRDSFASLRYSTTEEVRWEGVLPFTVARAVMDAKAEHILFLDKEGGLHRWKLNDPHPEAGWNAFFGKIWYEGADKPGYIWQSTGGTDDFEPKLSLTPLIIGSLKGTFFALLFAVPIALLAAIYTSCFLPARIKSIVKPVMEIMASLPSVVLGFLAGLWLAPLIESKVPSLLLGGLALPLGAMAVGWVFTKLPVATRSKIKPGSEFWVLLPPVAVLTWIGWSLGPWLESWAFVVKDPSTGGSIADFRLWWPQIGQSLRSSDWSFIQWLGDVFVTDFDQRNSLVVGFMMGFAVIPILFTITEDALSNVPTQIKAASLALGASRWQMVRTVVLPVASAGIFSALMVAFGRAVGETMIVVMATGNTPVMDLNIFSGMRTLSANIAVELPEAAVHSTHYRALFLGAVVLFALTFVLNTFAELLRQRLRERFKFV